jgi:hypothetical protein
VVGWAEWVVGWAEWVVGWGWWVVGLVMLVGLVLDLVKKEGPTATSKQTSTYKV